mgnify:FL=1|jgi:hypothetical protein
MIREKIRQFFEQLMEELDELEEAHTIITRKPWVLWNDREEEQVQSSSFIQRVIDYFQSLRK